MNGARLLFILALLASAEEPSGTVRAVRYTVEWGESAMDLVHGGARKVTEIWFPDLGVGCILVPGQQGLEAKAAPRLHAFPSKAARNELNGEEGPSKLEEIEVSGALAKEIAALAELSARQENETWRLGAEVVRRGVASLQPGK